MAKPRAQDVEIAVEQAKHEAADGVTEGGDLVEIKYGDPFVQMCERLATNEAVDADKLEKLVDIQMRIMDRNAEESFNIALSQVQKAIPTVVHDAENTQTHSRYAKLAAIARAIKPIYTEHGFSTSFSQGTSDKENHIRILGTLRHSAGHKEADYFTDLPYDKTGIKGNVNKTDLHAAGSTFKYGRRYLTCLMFDVNTDDEDDDGNAGSGVADGLTESEQIALHAKATDLFGDDRAARILHNLASQYFRIKSGDWHNIPSFRFEDAIRKIKEKYDTEQYDQSGES